MKFFIQFIIYFIEIIFINLFLGYLNSIYNLHIILLCILAGVLFYSIFKVTDMIFNKFSTKNNP